MTRLVIAIAMVAAGCAGAASTPPQAQAPRSEAAPVATSINDARAIAGTWDGTARVSGSTFPYKLTIKPDGTWSAVTPQRTFEGRYTVKDGKANWVSDTTGSAGTWTLHEGGGQRMLAVAIGANRVAEFGPVK